METVFIVALLSRKSIMMGHFIFQKTVSMTFLTDRAFTFPESQCVSTSRIVFSAQARCSKLMLNSFINISLTKPCIIERITHSFANFIWFTILNYQHLIMDLCSSLEHCLIWRHFLLSQNKYFCEIMIIFSITNSKRCKVFIYENNSEKNIIFSF